MQQTAVPRIHSVNRTILPAEDKRQFQNNVSMGRGLFLQPWYGLRVLLYVHAGQVTVCIEQ